MHEPAHKKSMNGNGGNSICRYLIAHGRNPRVGYNVPYRLWKSDKMEHEHTTLKLPIITQKTWITETRNQV